MVRNLLIRETTFSELLSNLLVLGFNGQNFVNVYHLNISFEGSTHQLTEVNIPGTSSRSTS